MLRWGRKAEHCYTQIHGMNNVILFAIFTLTYLTSCKIYGF